MNYLCIPNVINIDGKPSHNLHTLIQDFVECHFASHIFHNICKKIVMYIIDMSSVYSQFSNRVKLSPQTCRVFFNRQMPFLTSTIMWDVYQIVLNLTF